MVPVSLLTKTRGASPVRAQLVHENVREWSARLRVLPQNATLGRRVTAVMFAQRCQSYCRWFITGDSPKKSSESALT